MPIFPEIRDIGTVNCFCFHLNCVKMNINEDLETRLNNELNKLADTRSEIYDTMDEISTLINSYNSFKEISNSRPNASFKDFADDEGNGPPQQEVRPPSISLENQFTYFGRSLPGQPVGPQIIVGHSVPTQAHILKRLVETREATAEEVA